MSDELVRDYHGDPLTDGAHVEAWLDGTRYTATVKEIKPHHPGDGDLRRIILALGDDPVEAESYSDAVVVIKNEDPDLIPALLSRGGPVTSQEQADALGLGSAYRQQIREEQTP